MPSSSEYRFKFEHFLRTNNISRTELSEESGVSPRTIHSIVHNTGGHKSLGKILAALRSLTGNEALTLEEADLV